MKRLYVALIILLVVAGLAAAYLWYRKSQVPSKILTFEDCSKAGNLVVETNPRECHTKEGHLYIEEDNHVVLGDYIEVTEPKPYTILSSPFKIQGQAVDGWFGGGRLNIKLVDQGNRLIAEKPVFALSDKANKGMVPFVAAVDFKIAENIERGKLLIEKMSTVDIPGKNGPLVIPVRFK